MEIIKHDDPELTMLLNNKEEGYNYRKRRNDDWLENYTLYRDKVIINRLTQRQSVNLPLMKSAVRTLLKDVDDVPNLYLENLDNNKQSELFQNEHWKYTTLINKLELQDIVDKRQVFLFGRSFKQMQIADGNVKISIVDPQDTLVSRYVDPVNLHSSRYLIHQHIFVPLASLEKNPDYDKQAITDLKTFYATEQGLIKVATNEEMMLEKNKKLEQMGVPDLASPILGETWVELTLHFLYRDEDDQIYLYVECEDQKILMKKPLEQVIGTTKDHYWRNHFPYNTWGDDIEHQDFWSDATGDIIRTPNKILNSWFSQMVENRTMRNFNMHYYNSSIEGFTPQTYNPIPWGWYPIPAGAQGKIDDVLKTVEVPQLVGNIDDINFLLQMVEKATGATATQQGVQTERKITLGEVQLALGEAKERVKGMSKFYTPAWEEVGNMYLKLLEAAPEKLDVATIYKKGRMTDNTYSKDISPSDWMSKKGYHCKVWSQEDKNTKDDETLQKMAATQQIMMGNPKFDDIYKRKLLEFDGLKPEEINDVMEFEEQKREMMTSQIGMQPAMPGQAPMPPVAPPAQTL